MEPSSLPVAYEPHTWKPKRVHAWNMHKGYTYIHTQTHHSHQNLIPDAETNMIVCY